MAHPSADARSRRTRITRSALNRIRALFIFRIRSQPTTDRLRKTPSVTAQAAHDFGAMDQWVAAEGGHRQRHREHGIHVDDRS